MFDKEKRQVREREPITEQQFMDYTVEWLSSIHAQLDRSNLFLEKIARALEA